MRRHKGLYQAASRRGNAVLEYVIIAVGIAIFCTFGILMFGRTAQGQMDAATQVLSGAAEATSTEIHAEAKNSAEQSDGDITDRKGTTLDRD
jgi:hypothetical protein